VARAFAGRKIEE